MARRWSGGGGRAVHVPVGHDVISEPGCALAFGRLGGRFGVGRQENLIGGDCRRRIVFTLALLGFFFMAVSGRLLELAWMGDRVAAGSAGIHISPMAQRPDIVDRNHDGITVRGCTSGSKSARGGGANCSPVSGS